MQAGSPEAPALSALAAYFEAQEAQYRSDQQAARQRQQQLDSERAQLVGRLAAEGQTALLQHQWLEEARGAGAAAASTKDWERQLRAVRPVCAWRQQQQHTEGSEQIFLRQSRAARRQGCCAVAPLCPTCFMARCPSRCLAPQTELGVEELAEAVVQQAQTAADVLALSKSMTVAAQQQRQQADDLERQAAGHRAEARTLAAQGQELEAEAATAMADRYTYPETDSIRICDHVSCGCYVAVTPC